MSEIQQDFWSLDISGKEKKGKKVLRQVKMSESLDHLIDLYCEDTGVSFSFGTRCFWYKIISNRREYPGMIKDPLKEINVAASDISELLPTLIRQYETMKMQKVLDKNGISLYK